MSIVTPVVTESSTGFAYAVTPDARYQHAKSLDPDHFAQLLESESPEFCIVGVDQLLYPGDSWEPLAERWLYIFQHYAPMSYHCVAEIDAREAGQWYGLAHPDPYLDADQRNPDSETAGTWQLENYDELGAAYEYGFFVSPFQLGGRALRRLLVALNNGEVALATELFTGSSARVAAPDPFAWAAAAASKYHTPALAAWQDWVQDTDNQARLFIASVVKSWIEADDGAGGRDPLDIADEVSSGEPDSTIAAYKAGESSRRETAERAAAYVAHCVDGRDFRVIEQSAMDGGGQPLSDTFQHWAVIVNCMMMTAPGRDFLDAVCDDPERITGAFLFTEESPLQMPDFGTSRYAWLAATSVFSDVAPAMIAKFGRSRWRAMTIQQKMVVYLNNIKQRAGIESFTDVYEALHTNLASGEVFYAGAPNTQTRRHMIGAYKRLTKEAAEWGERPTNFSAAAGGVDTLHKGVAAELEKIELPVGGVIEVINLGIALQAWNESNPEQRRDARVNLLGAAGDLSVFVVAAYQKMVGENMMKAGLARAGGAAALVAGICETLAHISNAVQAANQNDWGASVGHGIAAVGGYMTAVSGTLLLMSAVSTGTLTAGPVGAAIGAIGAVVILGGTLLAAYLTSSAYELFARGCFLGKSAGDGPWKYDWTSVLIGERNPATEAKALSQLIGAFSVRGYKALAPARLVIKPGYMPQDAYFQVSITNRWYGAGWLMSTSYIYPEQERCVQVTGRHPVISDDIRFDRDESGRVKRIHLTVEHQYSGTKGSYEKLKCYVRMVVGDQTGNGKGEYTTPLEPDWTDYLLVYPDLMASVDSDDEVSSLERHNPL